ncbi:MAG: hypothetical protein ACRDFW_01910, partial [bacterium]
NEAVRKDRSKIHIIDLTGLGLVEITRKRVYQDLEEIMRIPCPYCEGRGRVLSPETMSMRTRREVRRLMRTASAAALLVEVHPDVYKELFRDGPSWVRQLEEQTGRRLTIRGRDGMHLERMRVVEGERVEDLGREETARDRRGQVYWLDREGEDTLVFSERDVEQELAVAAAGNSRNGLMRRLLKLLGRS